MARAYLQLILAGGTAGMYPGGVRLGPFSGQIRVGSDPQRSQVLLDVTSQVLAEHAVITLYPSGVFGVEPRPNAGVWLAIQGQAQVWPLSSAVQVNPGDHLIFGTPGGPRFQLQLDTAPAQRTASHAIPAAPTTSWAPPMPGSGMNRGQQSFTTQVGNELVRQSTVRMLARAGPIRDAYYLWNRLRGGSLSSPYVVASILFTLMAAVSTGTLSCTGLLSAVWWKLMHH